jgi:hypothetical protein
VAVNVISLAAPTSEPESGNTLKALTRPLMLDQIIGPLIVNFFTYSEG